MQLKLLASRSQLLGTRARLLAQISHVLTSLDFAGDQQADNGEEAFTTELAKEVRAEQAQLSGERPHQQYPRLQQL